MLVLLRLVLLLFVVLLLLVGGMMQVGMVQDAPVLTFIASRDSIRDIYALDSQTEILHNLTQSNTAEWSFTWTQDGQRVLYSVTAASGSGDELWVMDANGRQATRNDNLTTMLVLAPVWSPDGAQIAYVSSHPRNFSDIFVITLADNSVQNITNTPTESEYYPLWSPDGKYLTYIHADRLYRLTLADGTTQQLTPNARSRDLLRYSPDAQWLAFVEQTSPPTLVLMSADGQQTRTIPATPKFTDYAWSPDSSALAFVQSNQQLALYDMATAALDVLTNGAGRVSGVAWSDDGRYLAFIENRALQLWDLHRAQQRTIATELQIVPPLQWR